MSVAQEAVATMRELGYPEHVIQGFLMNYQDESGLVADVEEAEPNVHGTRGKGIYQLTGDRRSRFEEMYKGDWSTRNQILYQDWELRNTEQAAREAIWASENAGQAGAAIVNKFLRPAEEHRAAREAAYMGAVPEPLPEGVPAEEEDSWLTKDIEVTGNEFVDDLLTEGRDTGVGLAKEAAISAIFGGGGSQAPAPPPLQPMRPIQSSGPVMFKIKRKRDKQ